MIRNLIDNSIISKINKKVFVIILLSIVLFMSAGILFIYSEGTYNFIAGFTSILGLLLTIYALLLQFKKEIGFSDTEILFGSTQPSSTSENEVETPSKHIEIQPIVLQEEKEIKKMKEKMWLRALIVLVTLAIITLGVVVAVFRLSNTSTTDWMILLGSTCVFFTVILAVMLKSYEQLLKILWVQLIAFLMSFLAPETTPDGMLVIPKGGWMVMLLVLIVGGYIYFAFRFITEGSLKNQQ